MLETELEQRWEDEAEIEQTAAAVRGADEAERELAHFEVTGEFPEIDATSAPAKPSFIKRAVEKIFGKKIPKMTDEELQTNAVDAVNNALERNGLKELSDDETKDINNFIEANKRAGKTLRSVGIDTAVIGVLLSILGVSGVTGVGIGILGVGVGVGVLNKLGKGYRSRKITESDKIKNIKAEAERVEALKGATPKANSKDKKRISDAISKGRLTGVKEIAKELKLSESVVRAIMFAESGNPSMKSIILEAINKKMDYREAKEYAESQMSEDTKPLTEADVVEILEAIKSKGDDEIPNELQEDKAELQAKLFSEPVRKQKPKKVVEKAVSFSEAKLHKKLFGEFPALFMAPNGEGG